MVEQINQADRLAEQRKRNEARKLYDEAALRAHAESNLVLESRALAGIGGLLNSEGNYAEARQFLERALALADSAGDNLVVAREANWLGLVMASLGQVKEARARYEKSARAADAAGELHLKALALSNLAMASAIGPELFVLLSEVIEIARRLGDTMLEAGALHSWGDRLFEQGEFAAAMEKLESAATLYEQIKNQRDLARVYTSMGRLNRAHGRAADAIPLYEKALRIQQQTGDKTGVIQSLNATAVAYGALGQNQKARELYERAYTLALETKSPRVIDFMRGNLAGKLIDMGEYSRGAELLEDLLRSGVESYPEIRHTQLAYAYLKMGRLDEALLHADKGVELSVQHPTNRPSALLQRAEVRERRDDIARALGDAREAIQIIEGLRAKLVPLDFMKQGFSGIHQSAYTTLIGLHYRQGQQEEALEVAELARARALLDLLATREIRLKEADQAEIAELRRTDRLLREQGIHPDGVAGASGVVPQPRDLTDEADRLRAKWKTARPELLSFVAASPHKVPQLIATAKRLRSTILSYWSAHDALYIGVIPPNGKVDLQRVELTERHLASLINSAMKSVSDQRQAGPVTRGEKGQAGLPESTDAWPRLYRFLIQPVHSLLPPPGSRLTIIPHGLLLRLPFAALIDENGRYLLEDYALHYAPAGALLDFTAAKISAGSEKRRYLFIADPRLPAPAKGEPLLPQLPGAREEVGAIARLLPKGSATILEGSHADERTVSQSMGRASVLHFATHGVIHDDQPLDSYLALGNSSEYGGDGRLTAQKLYGFDLHADLVVLSSCRSGGGSVTGEGISALARALFYAGAPAIIVSLWDVLDQPANRLLPSFYASWLRGRSRVDALRAAQLRLLADLRSGRVTARTPAGNLVLPEHPALWAGFILLGEP